MRCTHIHSYKFYIKIVDLNYFPNKRIMKNNSEIIFTRPTDANKKAKQPKFSILIKNKKGHPLKF